ncbi:MAG: resistance to Congo red protein, partial [Spirochaetes bacterium]|nr:resistance to Congo red protein [Spirochaetota bacterium]
MKKKTKLVMLLFFLLCVIASLFGAVLFLWSKVIDTDTIAKNCTSHVFDHSWAIAVIFIVLVILFVILIILHNISIRRKQAIITYTYANKLNKVLAKIIQSPVLSSGYMKGTADLIAQEACCVLNTSRVEVWNLERGERREERGERREER